MRIKLLTCGLVGLLSTSCASIQAIEMTIKEAKSFKKESLEGGWYSMTQHAKRLGLSALEYERLYQKVNRVLEGKKAVPND